MSTFEYKTVMVPYRPTVFQTDNNEIQDAINAVSKDGWRLSQIIPPSTLWGRSNGVLAVFERPKA